MFRKHQGRSEVQSYCNALETERAGGNRPAGSPSSPSDGSNGRCTALWLLKDDTRAFVWSRRSFTCSYIISATTELFCQSCVAPCAASEFSTCTSSRKRSFVYCLCAAAARLQGCVLRSRWPRTAWPAFAFKPRIDFMQPLRARSQYAAHARWVGTLSAAGAHRRQRFAFVKTAVRV